jgi:pyridoxamine 5'-phosphate oxidase
MVPQRTRRKTMASDPVLAAMRQEYLTKSLLEDEVPADPILQFRRWFEEAKALPVYEPNAMALATADRDGRPSVRMVLLKGVDERGLTFFTNLGSRKAREMGANPRAALTFWWGPMERQVRLEGEIEGVSDAEADAYFATRPRGAQVGAWASEQSAAIDGRKVLEATVREIEARYGEAEVPRPPHWGGYRLLPDAIEFWQGRGDRLHDRLLYSREGTTWRITRLAP